MSTYLWIALGGALGSVARALFAGWATRQWGEDFPWGTLIINIAGSLVIGFFAALTGPGGRWPAGDDMRQFFMVGVLGGFTTFSAFSLQTLALARAGEWSRAGGYVAGSMILCLLAVWLGWVIAAGMVQKGS